MISSKAKKANNKSGFTILETMVAITILAFAITATFTSAQSGLSSALESRDQIVAHYLAQEAIEFIRNQRDTNSLSGASSWLTGIALSGDPCQPGNVCNVDVANNTLVNCNGACAYLKQDSVSSMYGDATLHSTWQTTRYKREVTVSVLNSDEASVTVNIYVTKGSITQTFNVQESIFNWQS